MNKEIEDFIKKPIDYEKGLKILQSFSPHHVFLKILEKGFSMANKKKLILALSELNTTSNQPVIFPPTTLPLKETSKTQTNALKESADYNVLEKVTELKHNRARLINQATRAKVELDSLNLNKKNRFLRANLIVDSFDQLAEIWDALDYFEEFKQLPLKYSTSNNIAKQAIENMRRIQNLRTYLVRYNKKFLAAKTTESRNRIQRKIEEFQFELKSLINAH